MKPIEKPIEPIQIHFVRDSRLTDVPIGDPQMCNLGEMQIHVDESFLKFLRIATKEESHKITLISYQSDYFERFTDKIK